MSGLGHITARVLSAEAHLVQSIGDVLSTPRGSRVMRRAYGSDLPRLLDAPMNGATRVDLFAATAEALELWEPRFELTRVQTGAAQAGRLSLTLTGNVEALEKVVEIEVGRP